MKTLQKLRNLAAVLVLAAGMTSCLKTSEPDFAVAPLDAYILQNGTGENATFKPYIYLYGNKPMASGILEFEGQTYSFKEVTGSNGYYLEIPYSTISSVVAVKSWKVDIKAQSKVEVGEENPEYAVSSFTFVTSKALGEFSVAELKYETNQVTATWDKVENATDYILMSRAGNTNMWVQRGKFTIIEKEGKLTGTVYAQLELNKGYQLTIAAVNGAFVKIVDQRPIIIPD